MPDAARYSSPGVRERSAELSAQAVSGFPASVPQPFLPDPNGATGKDLSSGGVSNIARPPVDDVITTQAIEEGSEPSSLRPSRPKPSSVLNYLTSTDMMHDFHPTSPTVMSYTGDSGDKTQSATDSSATSTISRLDSEQATESTALLKTPSTKQYGLVDEDTERQGLWSRHSHHKVRAKIDQARERSRYLLQVASHPKSWDAKRIWRQGFVYPASLLPAVFLGLLLNLLDALSYGMILFPLGNPIFSDLGADGISIFFVSTIISQLVFSATSVFKGGVGSEMIEVVPFFHQMAFTIIRHVGAENEESVLATTVVAFSISSLLIGLAFFTMGASKIGALVGFFPRSLLIGCIGGVGYFLLITGVEVSARLDRNLSYNFDTLRQLFQLDTIFLWTVPLLLAVILLVTKRFVKSKFLVGGYFIAVAVGFYVIVSALRLDLASLRKRGWVFEAPAADKPWWHFYTLFNFKATNAGALADCIPAMLALVFFGFVHLPINLPSLAVSTGEDNLNVDRELISHGVSNLLSGCLGSVPNYLVYTNSLLFIDSGGDSRLAGVILAFATLGILVIGPAIIGLIPICVVGALIYVLGVELLEEALVDTWGKIHKLEYGMIAIIIVSMAWDFVGGILIGIVLACLNFVVQSSRKSAIRAIYSGEFAGSTVRRHPTQTTFLKETGQQIQVIKAAGYLFFGTIVALENKIRGLLDEEAFKEKPLKFLVIDLRHVSGVDFSASEAYIRINRILQKKEVSLVISGIQISSEVGKSLHNVGLFETETGVKIFETLNSALEYCENSLLEAFYTRQKLLLKRFSPEESSPQYLNIPQPKSNRPSIFAPEAEFSTPRRGQLHRVAEDTLPDAAIATQSRWAMFDQPLPLMLQLFENLSPKTEDFWFRAKRFFKKQEIPAGTVLYERGDAANAFLLIERGSLRADYRLPQGQYAEIIMAGRPCGELPFFSETERTATVVAEEDSVVWRICKEDWETLTTQEPDVATELLKVVLKLNKERMDSITRYILTSG